MHQQATHNPTPPASPSQGQLGTAPGPPRSVACHPSCPRVSLPAALPRTRPWMALAQPPGPRPCPSTSAPPRLTCRRSGTRCCLWRVPVTRTRLSPRKAPWQGRLRCCGGDRARQATAEGSGGIGRARGARSWGGDRSGRRRPCKRRARTAACMRARRLAGEARSGRRRQCRRPAPIAACTRVQWQAYGALNVRRLPCKRRARIAACMRAQAPWGTRHSATAVGARVGPAPPRHSMPVRANAGGRGCGGSPAGAARLREGADGSTVRDGGPRSCPSGHSRHLLAAGRATTALGHETWKPLFGEHCSGKQMRCVCATRTKTQ